jgi:hypothetical protein
MREIQERNEVMLHIANNFGVLAKLFAVLAAQSSGVGAWRFYSDHERAAVLEAMGLPPGSNRELVTAGDTNQPEEDHE